MDNEGYLGDIQTFQTAFRILFIEKKVWCKTATIEISMNQG